MYPTKMEANGHIYNINTDYRIALACLKAIDDEEISDLVRFYAIETLLLGEDVLFEDEPILREKIAIYLRCGRETNMSNDEIDMDYFQDEVEIKTSIRQCYNNLDISKLDYLHWYEYNELISGLTSDSLLNRIRDLRNYDTSDIDNPKQLEQILKAQQRVALKKKQPKLTKEQQESVDRVFKLAGIKKG